MDESHKNQPDHPEIDSETGMIATLVNGSTRKMEERLPDFLQDLRQLCLSESPSGEKTGLDRMADLLVALLQRSGVQTTLVEHPLGNAVVGTLPGSNPRGPVCLLLGHHDTVHPVGVAEARTHLEGERFYGPGTVDMKAGLLQGIYALDLLRQHGYADFQKILFLSVPDEEISRRYQVGLVRELAREHPLVLGLEGARSIGNVVLRRKGCGHYRLTAEGVAAHAGSAIEQGRNAVLELAHQIVQAQGLMGWREGLTINAGPIKGGSRANIVSDFAEIVFDLRFLRTQDQLDAVALWRDFLGRQRVPGVRLTLHPEQDMMPPMTETPESLKMAHQLELIAERILKTPFDPETRGGASDCCNTSAEGCPTLDGLGAIGDGAHTAQEYILVPTVPQRVALLAGLIASVTAPLQV